MIDFQTDPSRYRHWRLAFDGPVATLTMDVDPAAGLFEGCELKLNSYDLGVDIELADAVQRLRFEHPEVRCVVLRSGKEGVFCAGANIRMLAKASHGHKVNFCKFTNETRLAIEDASANSGQRWLAAVSGSAAGGGYELAMAADHIMLIDDRRSGVALPELPLLAVLPGTGGLTRLTDKRLVRRDRADVFCSTEEGVRGRRALEWRLVDEVVPPSAWETRLRERALALAALSDRPTDAQGIVLTPLQRSFSDDGVAYSHVRVTCDRAGRRADVTVLGPRGALPGDAAGIHAAGASFWPLAVARELDDAILHLRLNEPTLGLIVLRSEGDAAAVLAADELLEAHKDDWLVREIRLYLEARAEAHRHDLAQPDRADRAGKLLCRHARGTAVRRRSLGDVRGRAQRRQSRAGACASVDAEFRRVSDGQWTDASGDTLPRRTRQLRACARTHGRDAARRRMPRRSGWSPSPMTSRTGTMRCG